METGDLSETRKPLEDLVREIERHEEQSDEHVLAAAFLLREARERVEAGEAGDLKWDEWTRRNFHLSRSRMYELQRIAGADDPAAELKRLRGKTRERVRRHRDRKTGGRRQSEEERTRLIAWARRAPLVEVRRVVALVESARCAELLRQIEERLADDRLEAA